MVLLLARDHTVDTADHDIENDSGSFPSHLFMIMLDGLRKKEQLVEQRQNKSFFGNINDAASYNRTNFPRKHSLIMSFDCCKRKNEHRQRIIWFFSFNDVALQDEKVIFHKLDGNAIDTMPPPHKGHRRVRWRWRPTWPRCGRVWTRWVFPVKNYEMPTWNRKKSIIWHNHETKQTIYEYYYKNNNNTRNKAGGRGGSEKHDTVRSKHSCRFHFPFQTLHV